jgi:peptidoglycan/xylan/chitin deacetylase (PgdA/CDA1 family)
VLTAAILALVLFAWAVPPRLDQLARRRRLLRLCRQHRLIAITFDDGPGRTLTPHVLERLRQAQVPASFFVLGRALPDCGDLLAAMREAGHEIGSHGHDHVHHLCSLPWQGLRDARAGLLHLEGLLRRGPREVAFRPPHGKLNLLSWLWLLLRRTPIAGWTHDGCDARSRGDVPAEATATALLRSGGGVLLLHDFDRGIANPRARVLERLDAVLRLQREGFRFVRHGDLDRLAAGQTLPAASPAAAVLR